MASQPLSSPTPQAKHSNNNNTSRPFAAYYPPAIDVTNQSSRSRSGTETPSSLISPAAHTIDSTMDNEKRKRRKSWFGFGGKNKPPSTVDQARTPSLIPEDRVAPPSSWQSPEERLRPIQFAPNRIQTLYVTKSERDLYLAAMSQLDEAPPPLPLWADPAPALPRLDPTNPLPPLVIPNGSISSGHVRSMSEGTGHPLTSRPLSPKLVTSPQMGKSGLLVRDEFRKTETPRQARHALMALALPGSIRFTGLPVNVIGAIDMAIQESWGQGIAGRSEGAETLKNIPEGQCFTWRIDLQGKVWKRKGSQELDTIRLLLAILSVLGIHGWTLVQCVQAGGSKKDAHNLLFVYSRETAMNPPLFFALSIPLPDRLSLISAPAKSTPAIISALREAIVSNSPRSAHIRSGTANTGVTASTDSNSSDRHWQRPKSPKVKWKGYDPRGIKLEGWVHEGVYRFWIDGMRRWLGGTVRRRLVEHLHPSLLIAIINNISALHFKLAGSIPLLPIAKGRDVLFFSSLSGSGLSVRDTYVPRAPSIAGTESPVLVSPAASIPAQDIFDAQDALVNPRDVDHSNRKLPWASVINEHNDAHRSSDRSGSAPNSSQAKEKHRRAPSASRVDQPGPGSRKRTPSQESTKPLIRAAAPSPGAGHSANSTPKLRNVLLKKNSLQRRRSLSGNNSRQPSESARASAQDQYPASTGHHQAAQVQAEALPRSQGGTDDGSAHHVYGQGDDHRHFIITNPDRDSDSRHNQERYQERWSFIDPPPNVGKLGVTMFDATRPTHNWIPPSPPKDTHDTFGRASGEETAEPGGSVYADAQAHPHPHPHQRAPYHGEYDYRKSNESPERYPSPPAQVQERQFASMPAPAEPLAHTPDSELGTDLGGGSELNHAHPLTRPLALGQPIDRVQGPTMQPVMKDDSPQRRARHGIVEMSVNSVHGSVGYLASMLSGRSRGSVDGRGSMDMDRLPMHPGATAGSGGGSEAEDAGAGHRGDQNDFSVPQPNIKIIPSPTEVADGASQARGESPIPPPLPARPGQGAERNDALHRPPALALTPQSRDDPHGHGHGQGHGHGPKKYLEWERQGKVREGMRRVWDEDMGRWRDVPISTNGGVGSARTKVALP